MIYGWPSLPSIVSSPFVYVPVGQTKYLRSVSIQTVLWGKDALWVQSVSNWCRLWKQPSLWITGSSNKNTSVFTSPTSLNTLNMTPILTTERSTTAIFVWKGIDCSSCHWYNMAGCYQSTATELISIFHSFSTHFLIIFTLNTSIITTSQKHMLNTPDINQTTTPNPTRLLTKTFNPLTPSNHTHLINSNTSLNEPNCFPQIQTPIGISNRFARSHDSA